jgi:hypothetical protein
LGKLTPCSWPLLERPPAVQPLQNFLAYYGTRRFIAAFTRALHQLVVSTLSHISPFHPILSLQDPSYYYPPIHIIPVWCVSFKPCTKLTLHCNHRSGHLKTEHAENLLLLRRHLGNWTRGPAVSMRSELF